jgi:hypothetical protein
MLSTELEQKVIEITGCSTRTLKSVKKDLNVESFQSGRQWFSALPGQSAKNVQSATLRQIIPLVGKCRFEFL